MAIGIHLDISYAGTLTEAKMVALRRDAKDYRELLNRLAEFLETAAEGGQKVCNVDFMLTATAPAKATDTVTCASVIATDTLVVGGVTLTAIANAGNPTATQFRIGAGGGAGQDAECAANIVKAIMNNTSTNKLVKASSAAAVVTITALNPGMEGNYITVASTGGTMTVDTAALEGGAGRNAPAYTTGGSQTVLGTAAVVPFNPTTGAGRISFTTS